MEKKKLIFKNTNIQERGQNEASQLQRNIPIKNSTESIHKDDRYMIQHRLARNNRDLEKTDP